MPAAVPKTPTDFDEVDAPSAGLFPPGGSLGVVPEEGIPQDFGDSPLTEIPPGFLREKRESHQYRELYFRRSSTLYNVPCIPVLVRLFVLLV